MNLLNAKKMIYFWGLLLIALAWYIVRMWGQKMDDAEAFAWASRKEPLVFISEHAFDKDVESRAAEARENLKKYGNKWLSDSQVWVYVYRVHVPINKPVTDIEMNHAIWQEQVWEEVASRRAQWRAKKIEYIQGDAGKVFANQN